MNSTTLGAACGVLACLAAACSGNALGSADAADALANDITAPAPTDLGGDGEIEEASVAADALADVDPPEARGGDPDISSPPCPGEPPACPAEWGVCAAAGGVAAICTDGAWGCDLAAVPGWSDLDASCGDCLDNDCDGLVDEDDSNIDCDGVVCSCVPFTLSCDADADGASCCPGEGSDNCPSVPNPDQADGDGDGLGDACDADGDGDGMYYPNDNCPFVSNPDQADLDGDHQGDVCDLDDDGDGVADAEDCAPLDFKIGGVEACDGLDNDCDGAIDDGEPCPPGAVCLDGGCVAPGGCVFDGDCSDGDPCNGAETCDPLTGCHAGTAPDTCCTSAADCDDADTCTTDWCAKAMGECGHKAVSCFDGDPCTADACVPGQGCVYTPAPGAPGAPACQCLADKDCPASPCAKPVCVAGTCKTAAVSCDDLDPCTDDACEPDVGCVHLPKCTGEDADGDGVDDSLDNCPTYSNPGQEDTDGDGTGDVCDADDD